MYPVENIIREDMVLQYKTKSGSSLYESTTSAEQGHITRSGGSEEGFLYYYGPSFVSRIT